MTSEERRERRYQRRKAKRYEKLRSHIDKYDDFNRCANPSGMMSAHFNSRCGVLWKYAPALYDRRFSRNAQISVNRLQAGKDVGKGYHSFTVCERGKIRPVHSLYYTERVIRRSYCVNCLVPILSHNLIYDNGACIKGKGGAFTEDRLTLHLRDYYRTYGDNVGYVITVDFSKYFANIDHQKLFKIVDKYVLDPRLNHICKQFIEATDRESGTPGKGLFIGPEDSQILAMAFPNDIDHLIKDQWGVKWYGRYNDDSYLIVRDKVLAHSLLESLLTIYEAHGIIPNRKKTQIIKLSRGFTFMKTKWNLLPGGRVLKRVSRKGTVRERRKLKHFKKLLETGQMSIYDVCQSYMSWRGHAKRGKNSGRTVYEMDKLFYRLFGCKPWRKKGRMIRS